VCIQDPANTQSCLTNCLISTGTAEVNSADPQFMLNLIEHVRLHVPFMR